MTTQLADLRNAIIRHQDALGPVTPNSQLAAFAAGLFDVLLADGPNKRIESARRRFYGRMLVLGRRHAEITVEKWMATLCESITDRDPYDPIPEWFPIPLEDTNAADD